MWIHTPLPQHSLFCLSYALNPPHHFADYKYRNISSASGYVCLWMSVAGWHTSWVQFVPTRTYPARVLRVGSDLKGTWTLNLAVTICFMIHCLSSTLVSWPRRIISLIKVAQFVVVNKNVKTISDYRFNCCYGTIIACFISLKSVDAGKVNLMGANSIDHSKQKCLLCTCILFRDRAIPLT
jgi:hypothetical protein